MNVTDLEKRKKKKSEKKKKKRRRLNYFSKLAEVTERAETKSLNHK